MQRRVGTANDQRTRVRRSREEWEALVREQGDSEQSARAFCAERGLGYASFMQWRARLRGETDRGERPFLEITPVHDASVTPTPVWSVELQIGERCVLRIR